MTTSGLGILEVTFVEVLEVRTTISLSLFHTQVRVKQQTCGPPGDDDTDDEECNSDQEHELMETALKYLRDESTKLMKRRLLCKGRGGNRDDDDDYGDNNVDDEEGGRKMRRG
ncbi:hypothetical protein TWF481_005093 [Arthrobotrys musiformis]|uniref:Uncharacterized protein n=1 Tax=Arthrobotrys musiformis TaxID=47236 RepID=A0AAV9WCR0_9PEZI